MNIPGSWYDKEGNLHWDPNETSGLGAKETFESGAVRSQLDDVRYDLISPFGLRRLAETYAGGAKKYGDNNWRKGMPFSVLLNHVLDHLVEYLRGSGVEDHLAHAAWGLFAMMEFEATMPEMDDLYDLGDEVCLEEGEDLPYTSIYAGYSDGVEID